MGLSRNNTRRIRIRIRLYQIIAIILSSIGIIFTIKEQEASIVARHSMRSGSFLRRIKIRFSSSIRANARNLSPRQVRRYFAHRAAARLKYYTAICRDICDLNRNQYLGVTEAFGKKEATDVRAWRTTRNWIQRVTRMRAIEHDHP